MESIENEYQPKQELPNSNLVLILGIVSLIGCCISYGIIGLICSIISLVMAKSANELYMQHPDYYTESSYKNMTTGKTCATISLILSIIAIVVMIIVIVLFGVAGLYGAFDA